MYGAEQQGYRISKLHVSVHAGSARYTFLHQRERRLESQYSAALQQNAKDEDVSLFHPGQHLTIGGRVGRPSAFVQQHVPPADRNAASGSRSA